MSLHDMYDTIKTELSLLMNNSICVYSIAGEYGQAYLREIDLWTANPYIWSVHGDDFQVAVTTVPYPGDDKMVLSIVEFMCQNVLNMRRHPPACIAASVLTVLTTLSRPASIHQIDHMVNKIYVRGDIADIDKACIPLEYVNMFEKLSISV